MQCAYCGLPADTRDHVPPKCLLEKPYPDNLRTIKSCKKCNNGYSLDEQYILVVLSQIATSQSLSAKVSEGGTVHQALTRSPALDDRIIESLHVNDNGRICLTPEIERVERIVWKIAFGLFVLRYGGPPAPDKTRVIGVYPYSIVDSRPAHIFALTYTERFKPKRWTRVQSGVFEYIFVRMLDDGLLCIIDLYETCWGVVAFPSPSPGKPRVCRRGRAVHKVAPEEQLSLFGDTNMSITPRPS